jgi:hypothetical protein
VRRIYLVSLGIANTDHPIREKILTLSISGSADRGADKLVEERMRGLRLAQELGVELYGDEPRVVGILDDLDK